MSNPEKTGKLREIKDSILGVAEILRQIRAPEARESFNKIIDTSFVVKEIVDALKSPEIIKNIENVRLISENFNEASDKMQSTIRYLEETGVINEIIEFVDSARGTMGFIGEAGKDLTEISGSIKDIICSVRTAQSRIGAVGKKYHKVNPNDTVVIPDEMVITPDETEYYLRLGWRYLVTLPNGKVVVKRHQMERCVPLDNKKTI
jgi:hypothetical protein